MTPSDVAHLCSLPAPDLFKLNNRIAMVTGAHRGIGLEIAGALAEAGAIVYGIDKATLKSGDEWEKMKDRVKSRQRNNTRMEYRQGDVTDMKRMTEIVDDITKKEGGKPLDICVACAGILHPDDKIDSSPEKFMEIMNTNVNGMFCAAKAARDAMKKGAGAQGDRKWQKSIIFIASMSGSVANKGMDWVAYNASKAAVVQMAKSMACSLARDHIRVNSISPGYVRTEMMESFLKDNKVTGEDLAEQNPMKRLGEPHEMRGVVLWLAGDASTFCTGSDIRIDGGHCAW